MWKFFLPTRIFFGSGALGAFDLGQFKGQRVLLISSRSMEKYSSVARFADRLSVITEKFICYKYCGGEPDLAEVAIIRNIIEANDIHEVLAAGGGSVNDAGKAAAATAYSKLSLQEIFHNQIDPGAGSCAFHAIPTTAGTGTEVTPNAVLSDKPSRTKMSLRGKKLNPVTAIVDPELLEFLPQHVAASSGADALVQAIESFVSRHATPFSETIAFQSALLCERHLVEHATNNGIESREGMCLGSLMAGIAFSASRLGAVHGVVHGVGVLTSLPHGVCCAAFMPCVMEMNRAYCTRKYELLSNAWGEDPVEHVHKLFSALGLPENLKHLAVSRDDFEFIISASLTSGSLKANPREFGRDELMELLCKVM